MFDGLMDVRRRFCMEGRGSVERTREGVARSGRATREGADGRRASGRSGGGGGDSERTGDLDSF